jgi:ABC-type Fe3+/spermidine/putrescine transport system ATPase subunit
MARFIGSNQFIIGEHNGEGLVKTQLGDIQLEISKDLTEVLVYLPYSAFSLHHSGEGEFRGKIKRKSFQGETYRYDVFVPELNKDFSQIQDSRDFKWGEDVDLSINTQKINRAFPRFI